jgi:hypothetical protein
MTVSDFNKGTWFLTLFPRFHLEEGPVELMEGRDISTGMAYRDAFHMRAVKAHYLRYDETKQ